MNARASDAGWFQFACQRDDSILAAIEKCLDNRIGTCFVIGEDQRLIGRITLDDIRRAILDGSAIVGTGLERYMSGQVEDSILTPVVDGDGRLTDVMVDRSQSYIQIARPDLSHREFRAVLDAFLSSWISSKGACIQQFELEFAAFAGVKHGIATSNGTCALHLALLALGVGPGDEVIVPDLTFAATINAVLYCGATPVIVDVDPATWGMSVATAAPAFTTRTRAIIPVHLYGRPAEIGPLAAFARQRGCFVVEDCAEAHGARYAGRVVGGFSDVSCFSFYGNKIVTTGEGGMCLTNSDAIATHIREMRDHGMAPDKFYWHERVGYNYRMTNLQAAIGLAQLGRVQEILSRNANLEKLYREHFRDVPGIAFAPALGPEFDPVVWLVCALVPEARRAGLIEAAGQAGIELRPFFHPLSAMPAYAGHARSCPNSATLSRTGINLPTSSAVDVRVIERIGRVLRDILT